MSQSGGGLRLVLDVAQALGSATSAEEVLEATVASLRRALAGGAVTIGALDGPGAMTVLNAGGHRLAVARQGMPLDKLPVSQQVLATRAPVVLPVSRYPQARWRARLAKQGLRWIAAVPLLANGHALGVLGVARRERRRFSTREVECLQAVGAIVGGALEKSPRYEQLRARMKAEERLELLTRATNDALWDWDLATDGLWWNDGIRTLFGYAPDRVAPTLKWWAARVHAKDRGRVLSSVRQALRERRHDWRGEYRFRRADGSYATVIDRGYILLDGARRPVRMLGSVMDVSERRRGEEELQRSREQLRALSARLVSAREDERARLAREIHDELGQSLTALRIDAVWLRKRLAPIQAPAREDLDGRLAATIETVDEAIAAVRRIATELRPSILDELGLAAAVAWQAREFEARTGVRCVLRSTLKDRGLAPEVATATFRIFQEALTNVARHAAAKTVVVRLGREAGDVVLEVADDGRGIPSKAVGSRSSLGLLGMRERALSLGGRVAIERGRGTTVRVRLPFGRKRPT